MLEAKKKEYQEKAVQLLKENEKEIEQERTKIVSRARLEAKRAEREAEKAIFNEVVDGLLDYGEAYVQTPEYLRQMKSEWEEVLPTLQKGKYELICHERDVAYFQKEWKPQSSDLEISVRIDNDLIGGFMLTNPDEGVRYDFSIRGKIESNREKIGNLLMEKLR